MTRHPVFETVRSIYDDTIRDFLPRRWIVNNGVPTKTARLLDRTRHRPYCKEGSVRSLRRYVRPDDHVIVIGGGNGTTAVVAARRANRVTVYEAAEKMVGVVEETAELNSMEDKIDVVHSPVGPVYDAYGNNVGTTTPVSELPKCDVLELDCEGAEEEILPNLEQNPRVVIVEAHPQFGVSIDELDTTLSEQGYRTFDVRVENKPHVVVGVDPAKIKDSEMPNTTGVSLKREDIRTQ